MAYFSRNQSHWCILARIGNLFASNGSEPAPNTQYVRQTYMQYASAYSIDRFSPYINICIRTAISNYVFSPFSCANVFLFSSLFLSSHGRKKKHPRRCRSECRKKRNWFESHEIQYWISIDRNMRAQQRRAAINIRKQRPQHVQPQWRRQQLRKTKTMAGGEIESEFALLWNSITAISVRRRQRHRYCRGKIIISNIESHTLAKKKTNRMPIRSVVVLGPGLKNLRQRLQILFFRFVWDNGLLSI